MKRAGNIYPMLISDENIQRAIHAVNAGHRRTHGRLNKTVVWVEATEEERIKELRSIVENGFEPSPTHDFTRYDQNAKKTREIHEPKLYPDQYIHHMLIQAIEPVLMRGMDYWCCGSIPGRGASHGCKGIKRWMDEDVSMKAFYTDWGCSLGNNRHYNSQTHYAAELDIHHFYDNLTQATVMERMGQLIKDKRVLDLIRRVTNPGIMIGAYPSQWFANTVLQPLDHLIREKWGIKHYVRYMDNITIFSSSKKHLQKTVKEISAWLEGKGLRLKSNRSVYSTILSKKQAEERFELRGTEAYNRKHPRLVNAMGYMFGHGYVLIRKRNLLRTKRKLRSIYKKMDEGKEIRYKEAAGMLSRLGMLKHCNCRDIMERYVRKGTVPQLKDIVRKYTKELQEARAT